MSTTTGNTKNARLIAILTIATLILLTPLVAMQFTSEVDWDGRDFFVMGILLYGTGLACELVMRRFRSIAQRLVFCGVILLALFLVWAELAVGIFGTPFAGS